MNDCAYKSASRVVRAEYAEVPLEVLLSVGRSEPGRDLDMWSSHGHVDFRSWRYTSAQPVRSDRLRDVVRRLPANVYRCKGFIQDADDPTQRTLLQSVGRRVAITRLGDWGGEPARTDIVVIGSDLDEDALVAAFASCHRPMTT